MKIMKKPLFYFLLPAMVLALTAGFFFIPEREFSENENRYLAKAPGLSVESVLGGDFMEEAEQYVTDQFPFRDALVGLRTYFWKGAYRAGESQGIYLLRDEAGPYLIESYSEPKNTERIGGIIRGFKDILEEEGVSATLYLALVPTAVTVYEDELPKSAPDAEGGYRNRVGISQTVSAETIYDICADAVVDAWAGYELFAHRDEPIYFRTDHHWATLGAYYGTLPFLREAGIEPEPISNWTKSLGAGGFTGTLWSKSGDYSVAGEDIVFYDHPGDDIKVSYPDTGEERDGLYNMDYARKKDKYALFLNGLHPLVEISNEKAVTDRKLILIKDSYANAALPFLAHYFREIAVFDTRYYRGAVSDYAAENPEFTDILILYNMNTIDSDQGIRSIY